MYGNVLRVGDIVGSDAPLSGVRAYAGAQTDFPLDLSAPGVPTLFRIEGSAGKMFTLAGAAANLVGPPADGAYLPGEAFRVTYIDSEPRPEGRHVHLRTLLPGESGAPVFKHYLTGRALDPERIGRMVDAMLGVVDAGAGSRGTQGAPE